MVGGSHISPKNVDVKGCFYSCLPILHLLQIPWLGSKQLLQTRLPHSLQVKTASGFPHMLQSPKSSIYIILFLLKLIFSLDPLEEDWLQQVVCVHDQPG